jgi:RNA polymerase sigma-70 factor (ECF subfamily)
MLDCLAKMEREVFLLRFFDELSINEISRTLGRGESTVKTHLYRALRKVRDRAEKFDLELEV